MKVRLNENGWPIIDFEFDNGWTALIVPMAHGLNSCACWPTKLGALDTSGIGPQEAFDDEVVAFLAEVMARPKL